MIDHSVCEILKILFRNFCVVNGTLYWIFSPGNILLILLGEGVGGVMRFMIEISIVSSSAYKM
jgi:hypothetical protein